MIVIFPAERRTPSSTPIGEETSRISFAMIVQLFPVYVPNR
jgi:hypothetical protein